MDLTVSGEIYISKRSGVIDPYSQPTIDDAFVLDLLPFQLLPYTQALLATRETVRITENQLGFIGLRSTWARLGLIAPQTVADPGFNGVLTMEVFNSSRNPILIQEGDAIFHMFTVPTSGFVPRYKGRYQGQCGLTLPKSLEINEINKSTVTVCPTCKSTTTLSTPLSTTLSNFQLSH